MQAVFLPQLTRHAVTPSLPCPVWIQERRGVRLPTGRFLICDRRGQGRHGSGDDDQQRPFAAKSEDVKSFSIAGASGYFCACEWIHEFVVCPRQSLHGSEGGTTSTISGGSYAIAFGSEQLGSNEQPKTSEHFQRGRGIS